MLPLLLLSANSGVATLGNIGDVSITLLRGQTHTPTNTYTLTVFAIIITQYHHCSTIIYFTWSFLRTSGYGPNPTFRLALYS